MKNTKTIYDIAKEAGVSASTVSRVVNNKPGIREETRRRIRQLLEKYSYIPNEAARGLVTQSSRIIGILIEDIRIAHHTESAYIIEQEMTRLGYTCITLSTGHSPERKAEYIRILEQRRVEGVILMGSMFGTEEVRQSITEHMADIPIAIVNGFLDLPNVYGVLADEERGTEACVELLLSKGKRSIVFVSDVETPSNRNKRLGFLSAMERAGLCAAGAPPVYDACGKREADGTPEHTMERGREIARRILAERPGTDAFVCTIDLLAIGVLNELMERGISVPGQIAVTGVDNTLYGKICTPRLSTLDNKLVEVSRNASRLLLDALAGRKPVHKTLICTDIIERETT